MTAEDLIRILKLEPHPVEGGFFRETYRSADILPSAAIPAHGGARNVSTAIYYLLKPGHVSEMHTLPTDEVFHFYLGSPVAMLQLWPDGTGKEVLLGPDLEAGHQPQLVVPAGVWQGTRLANDHGYALLGCTVAPGFDFADYQRGERAALTARWPAFAKEIARLTPRG
jgi:predicted cupin superfamily sugar epimerase